MSIDLYQTKLDKLFELYTQNSFGAISKRELDIFLFQTFRELGKIKGNDSWSIAQELKVSKAKAQTLLYESSLRYKEENNIKQKIKDILNTLPRLQDGGIIWLIVDDKYARETMRAYLMEKKIVSDLSFASEIVKIPAEGYWELQQHYNNDNVSKLKRQEFLEAMANIPKEFVGKVLSDAVGESASKCAKDFLSRLIESVKTNAKRQ